MAMQKSAQSIREELRVLNAAADDVVKTDNFFTPEFWTMVVSAVTNLVAVGTVLGWISASDAESLTKALSALLGSAQVIIVNAALVWKYIAARVQVKEAMIIARYQYMTTIAAEKLRLEAQADKD